MSTQPDTELPAADAELEMLQQVRARGQQRKLAALARIGLKFPDLKIDEHLDALAADLSGTARKGGA